MANTEVTMKKGIIDQLSRDSRVDASKVKVKVKGSEVRLTGKINTYSAKKIAEAISWIIPGVKRVVNDLEIEYIEPLKVPSESELKSNVEKVLKVNPDIVKADIEVTIDTGVITLEGTVKTYWEKMRAEEIAFNVTGVLSVRNELAVVPTEKADDDAIGKELVKALDQNPKLNINDIDVEVRNGFVKLSGNVIDWNARQTAEDVASYKTGVIGVENNLVIGS